jgi:hypothetical protein
VRSAVRHDVRILDDRVAVPDDDLARDDKPTYTEADVKEWLHHRRSVRDRVAQAM